MEGLEDSPGDFGGERGTTVRRHIVWQAMESEDAVKEQLNGAIGVNGVRRGREMSHFGKSIDEDAYCREAIRRWELRNEIDGDRGPRAIGDR